MTTKFIQYRGAVYRLSDTVQTSSLGLETPFVSVRFNVAEFTQQLQVVVQGIVNDAIRRNVYDPKAYQDLKPGDGLLPGHEHAVVDWIQKTDPVLFALVNNVEEYRNRLWLLVDQVFYSAYLTAT